MPGFLLHQTATVKCLHGGTAVPTVVSQRVFVGTNPITTMPYPWSISGCSLASIPAPFCAMANWISASEKVFSDFAPVLLFDSQATCPAPGTGVIVSYTQQKVSAR